MRRRQFAALLATTGTGGCLRLTGSTSPTPADRSASPEGQPTSTQAPSSPQSTHTGTATSQQAGAETDTPSGTGSSPYPPGLTDDGVESNLFEIHKFELSGTTYRAKFAWRGPAGTPIPVRQYDVGSDLAIGTWTYDRGGPVTMARTGEGGFWREDLGDSYTYGEGRRGYDVDRLTWARWLDPVLDAGQWSSPTVVQEQNPRIWRVETTSASSDGTLPGWHSGQYSSLVAGATVDERGIVRTLRADYDATLSNGREIQRSITHEVSKLGEVSVQTPSWLSTAKDRRPQVSASLTDDRRYIRFELEAGNPIMPSTTLAIHDRTQIQMVVTPSISSPIETGEIVYLYKEQGDGGHGQLSRGSRPADASPVTLENEYTMWASRSDPGAHVYFDVIRVDS